MEPSFQGPGGSAFFGPVDLDVVRRIRGSFLGIGAVFVVFGVLAILMPFAAALVTTIFLGWMMLLSGLFEGYLAIQHRVLPVWGWLLFDGGISMALGILILAGWPGSAIWALGLLIGIQLVSGGLSLLMIGLGARSPARMIP
jgi:uncharacterized membrane protein HdeD (DUF308 family)